MTGHAQMVDDQIRLLVMQQQLEQESTAHGRPFVGLSVNATIRQCLLAGLDKKADKARSEFKVPDKRFVPVPPTTARASDLATELRSKILCLVCRFWYIKLRALVALRDWDALDSFARAKKSPIGYEPWVDELIRAGAQRQAVRYVDRCDPRNRVELYIKCGEWVMAGQECARRGERGRLQCVPTIPPPPPFPRVVRCFTDAFYRGYHWTGSSRAGRRTRLSRRSWTRWRQS